MYSLKDLLDEVSKLGLTPKEVPVPTSYYDDIVEYAVEISVRKRIMKAPRLRRNKNDD